MSSSSPSSFFFLFILLLYLLQLLFLHLLLILPPSDGGGRTLISDNLPLPSPFHVRHHFRTRSHENFSRAASDLETEREKRRCDAPTEPPARTIWLSLSHTRAHATHTHLSTADQSLSPSAASRRNLPKMLNFLHVTGEADGGRENIGVRGRSSEKIDSVSGDLEPKNEAV